MFLRRHSLAIQREKDAELRAKFNIGFVTFSITERNQIVPRGSQIEDILKIDWSSGYEVISISEKRIALKLPNMVFQAPTGGKVVLNGCTVEIFRRWEPFARPGTVIGTYRLAYKYLGELNGFPVIAMGVQHPPEPRPSMEELAKYS